MGQEFCLVVNILVCTKSNPLTIGSSHKRLLFLSCREAQQCLGRCPRQCKLLSQGWGSVQSWRHQHMLLHKYAILHSYLTGLYWCFSENFRHFHFWILELSFWHSDLDPKCILGAISHQKLEFNPTFCDLTKFRVYLNISTQERQKISI